MRRVVHFKAAFVLLTLRDGGDKNLDSFAAHLQGLENALPIDPKYRNPRLGALAPIRVVNVVFTAGDANRGVQTAAFNLPNDERVVKEKGTKRVMLKNVQDAKFRMVLQPIARVALPAATQKDVSRSVLHPLLMPAMHGLGRTSPWRRATNGRQELKGLQSNRTAKADVQGCGAATAPIKACLDSIGDHTRHSASRVGSTVTGE